MNWNAKHFELDSVTMKMKQWNFEFVFVEFAQRLARCQVWNTIAIQKIMSSKHALNTIRFGFLFFFRFFFFFVIWQNSEAKF